MGREKEYKIELVESTQLPAGAVMAYQHGGGAGFGPAIDRDPAAVKEGVLDEYVSLAAARTKYGVVLNGSLEEYDLAVDVTATQALRKEMRAAQMAQGAGQ